MATKGATAADPLAVVSELIDIGAVDTVYRDVYLHRARTLLAGVISAEDFRRLQDEEAELGTLPVTLGRALQRGDWSQVKQLSSRAELVRRGVEARKRHVDVARGVYLVGDVKLDPFSPGLTPFTRLGARQLGAMRIRALERLASLQKTDAAWKEFHAGRRAAFERLTIGASEESGTGAAAGMDPREAAQRALKSGDMATLTRLADTLIASTKAATAAKPRRAQTPDATSRSAPAQADFVTAYSEETVTAARRLGLAPRRMSAMTELAALREYVWNPLVTEDSGQVKIAEVPLPVGTPEAFRERFEMLMIHPLVNSGGARHLPRLLAEDVLVEDFPDPKDGAEAPTSELIARLGFSSRRALPRIAIEQALVAHGADILDKDLRLDPRAFRLVCVPPDVHLRLGEQEHWGRQPFWTHFDGYIVMANGRLRALAGGDVRYGGLYELVGIGQDYDSDRVIARFAVVRRERMVAW